MARYKALEVLELLADSAEGLTMAEIVSTTGRSMGELYRLVVALERHQLILRDEKHDRYTLWLRLFELAHRHPPTERLLELAQPIVNELSHSIEQSCRHRTPSGRSGSKHAAGVVDRFVAYSQMSAHEPDYARR